MILTNKLLPVALIAALIGGSVGALVMHKSQSAEAETTTAAQTTAPATTTTAQTSANEMVPAEFNTAGEQTAYKTGFADGFAAATNPGATTATTARRSRVVYRNSGSRASSSRVYYDYSRKRSFWDKHRDKLTVAMGTGGGALLGGLIGGKRGAAIGALSGAGGSALWTYKIRNRNRNY
jgi:ABC-type Na+ efflux pump permease subunit